MALEPCPRAGCGGAMAMDGEGWRRCTLCARGEQTAEPVNPSLLEWQSLDTRTPEERRAQARAVDAAHRLAAEHKAAGRKPQPRFTTKLTPDDVRAIRAAYAGGEPQRSLARRFGVCKATVGQVVRRTTWKNIA